MTNTLMPSLHRLAVVFLVGLALVPAASGAPAKPVAVRCGRLIDGRTDDVRSGALVLVEGERIKAVGAGLTVPADATVVDLSRSTCLPGLIDNHTHILLQGDITAFDYDEALLKESIPYRAIRATVLHEDAGDLSSLENPASLEKIETALS